MIAIGFVSILVTFIVLAISARPRNGVYSSNYNPNVDTSKKSDWILTTPGPQRGTMDNSLERFKLGQLSGQTPLRDISPEVSSRIQRKLETRDTNKVGLFAFFNRKGEEARANLARAQAEHASALSALESARQGAVATEFAGQTQQNDLVRAKIVAIEQTKVALATAQQQIEFITIQTQLAKEAASRGFTPATDEELRKKEHEVTQELRKMEEQARIETKKLEEQKRIEYEYSQKAIDEEVKATFRLSNTQELVRAQQVEMLLDYGKRLEEAKSVHERLIYEGEIARLKKVLYEQPSGMASEENAGEDAQGSAASS